ncbi:hypothetical protein BH23ACT9_BH23ACT9_29460 [soil metagenome]
MNKQDAQSRHEQRLWLLTGLLVGVALWLGTDNVVLAVLVGLPLGLLLAGRERLAGSGMPGGSDVGRTPAGS